MPVLHRDVRYNCRVFLLNRKILLIRPEDGAGPKTATTARRATSPPGHTLGTPKNTCCRAPFATLPASDRAARRRGRRHARHRCRVRDLRRTVYAGQPPHWSWTRRGGDYQQRLGFAPRTAQAAKARRPHPERVGQGRRCVPLRQPAGLRRRAAVLRRLRPYRGERAGGGAGVAVFASRRGSCHRNGGLEEVRSFRSSFISRMVQGSEAPPVPRVYTDFELTEKGYARGPTPTVELRFHTLEEESPSARLAGCGTICGVLD